MYRSVVRTPRHARTRVALTVVAILASGSLAGSWAAEPVPSVASTSPLGRTAFEVRAGRLVLRTVDAVLPTTRWDDTWHEPWNERRTDSRRQRDRDWDADWDRDDSAWLPTRVEFFPALDPAWRPGITEEWRIDRDSRFGLGFGAYLNRVDGFSPLVSQEIENRGWVPTLRFYEGYGFQSEQWSGAAEALIHPFHESLSLGARWGDETAAWPLPQQAISATENFIAAFMTRDDFPDYLRRESRSYYAAWAPFDEGGVQIAYLDETHESQRRRVARWGIFGGDQRFSSNPEVDEGEWHSLRARVFWLDDSRTTVWGPRGGRSLALDAQWTGGRFGGERGFTRLWAEHRDHHRLTPAQGFGYRLVFGGVPQGTLDDEGSLLPRQWQFQAGGVGSLRGHEFQEFRGDRLALASLEYGVDVGANVVPVLFVDGGKAWNESENASGGVAGSGPLALDGGIGLMLGADALRVDIARDLRAEQAPARVTVRFANSF